MNSSGEMIFFGILAAVSVLCAVLMVIQENPVRSALNLVIVLVCMALLFLALHAAFIAAIQVIVYAGAIMVLFIFVIMLLNLGAPTVDVNRLKPQTPLAYLAGIVLIGVIASALASIPTVKQHLPFRMTSAYDVGVTLFTPTWVFPFEAVSILLLIAAIGAVILAKRRLD